jgi:hypothetical protein
MISSGSTKFDTKEMRQFRPKGRSEKLVPVRNNIFREELMTIDIIKKELSQILGSEIRAKANKTDFFREQTSNRHDRIVNHSTVLPFRERTYEINGNPLPRPRRNRERMKKTRRSLGRGLDSGTGFASANKSISIVSHGTPPKETAGVFQCLAKAKMSKKGMASREDVLAKRRA